MGRHFAVFVVVVVLLTVHSDGKKLRQGPICSSQGIKYDNMCDFLHDTCKPNDKSYDNVFIMRTTRLCDGKKDVIYDKRKSIVCMINGTRLETKQRCEVMKSHCKNETVPQILHSGNCGICKRKNVCPWLMKRKSTGPNREENGKRRRLRRSFMICANDGTSYRNICEFSIARCLKFRRDGTILKYEKMVKALYGGRHLIRKCIREEGTSEPKANKDSDNRTIRIVKEV